MNDVRPGITQLGYAGFAIRDAAGWERFAEDVLGAQVVSGEPLLLRLDERAYRIALHRGSEDRYAYSGWEVRDTDALDAIVARLEAAGVTVGRASTAEVALRQVRELVAFSDPDGNRTELYCGQLAPVRTPFVSPVALSGFKAGSLGLGHVTLTCSSDLGALATFYRDVLGMRVSDYITLTARGPGVEGLFLHCNPRHHSLALIHVPGKPPGEVLHLMLEVNALDDVGLMIERCFAEGTPITRSLGRHSNDKMVSVYVASPSRFDLEYGWGAREIDDRTWSVERYDVARSWGAETTAQEIERLRTMLERLERYSTPSEGR
jgi:2,3-dihydroxybiphenyl 1,2-dioxygenase